jgi:hypothetical protein
MEESSDDARCQENGEYVVRWYSLFKCQTTKEEHEQVGYEMIHIPMEELISDGLPQSEIRVMCAVKKQRFDIVRVYRI